jgi:hypothetical protein
MLPKARRGWIIMKSRVGQGGIIIKPAIWALALLAVFRARVHGGREVERSPGSSQEPSSLAA